KNRSNRLGHGKGRHDGRLVVAAKVIFVLNGVVLNYQKRNSFIFFQIVFKWLIYTVYANVFWYSAVFGYGKPESNTVVEGSAAWKFLVILNIGKVVNEKAAHFARRN